MKVTVPEKEVEVCDLCQHDGYLETCLFCQGKFCLTCHGIIPGCIHKVQVCRKCGGEPALREIVSAYVPRLTEILNERDADIIELGNKRRED